METKEMLLCTEVLWFCDSCQEGVNYKNCRYYSEPANIFCIECIENQFTRKIKGNKIGGRSKWNIL